MTGEDEQACVSSLKSMHYPFAFSILIKNMMYKPTVICGRGARHGSHNTVIIFSCQEHMLRFSNFSSF